jgi:hypothetical protein
MSENEIIIKKIKEMIDEKLYIDPISSTIKPLGIRQFTGGTSAEEDSEITILKNMITCTQDNIEGTYDDIERKEQLLKADYESNLNINYNESSESTNSTNSFTNSFDEMIAKTSTIEGVSIITIPANLDKNEIKNVLSALSKEDIILFDSDAIKFIDGFASSETEHITTNSGLWGTLKNVVANFQQMFIIACKEITATYKNIYPNKEISAIIKTIIIRIIYGLFKDMVAYYINGAKAQFIKYLKNKLSGNVIKDMTKKLSLANESAGSILYQMRAMQKFSDEEKSINASDLNKYNVNSSWNNKDTIKAFNPIWFPVKPHEQKESIYEASVNNAEPLGSKIGGTSPKKRLNHRTSKYRTSKYRTSK